jgi:molybdenum cofactor biosynthesis enzyme MoaA
MANLSVTRGCNRNCSYCFARDAFASPGQSAAFISRRDFLRALDFLERSGIDQARLLGGEPTLHPEFPYLVDRVLERGRRLLVFSNGLMPEAALRRLEHTPVDRVAVLINVNAPGNWQPQEQA